MVAAMIQGFAMAATGATQYITLHIVMVLSGGVVGILFGTVFRAWPKAAGDGWAGAQFIVWNVGILIQAIGAVLRAWGWGDAVVTIGSVVVLVGAAMMLVIFDRNARA